MVWPYAALMALGGTGLQMAGQDQRTGAQNAARSGLKYATKMNAAGADADRAITQGALGGLAEQWNQSNEQAIDDLSAANMRGGFSAGSQQLQDRIASIQAGMPGGDALAGAADNVAFQNTLARQKASNQIRTDALQEVLENNAGLEGMGETVRKGRQAQGDRAMMIQERIGDILKLQNYADAVRNAALARAGAEHGLDQARAASVGSGAMYLGALMQAGAPLANQGGWGSWLQSGMTGQYGDPAAGVDAPSNLANTNPQV